MTKRSGEMGEPWGVPTATGENILGDPGKRSLHMRLVRKQPTHAMRYLWAPLARSADMSWPGSTLSKPPLMSRNKDETLDPSLWRRRISCVRVDVASKVERPRRDPVWWGCSRPTCLARRERREAVTHSSILERVSSKTMTLKEAGVS